LGQDLNLSFCFHGYGEDASSFEFLENFAGQQLTFYAIDLPFHGQTVWNEGRSFTINDLKHLIEKILNQDNQQPVTSNQQLSLLGFSLGGRIRTSLIRSHA
jgi:alpha-beta hydrolase superfamily lysophospholipase